MISGRSRRPPALLRRLAITAAAAAALAAGPAGGLAAPVTVPDAITADEAAIFYPLSNDESAEAIVSINGQVPTAGATDIAVSVVHGSLWCATFGTCSYVPARVGTDIFTYVAADAGGAQSSGTITVTVVNSRPSRRNPGVPSPEGEVAGPPLGSKGKMSLVYDFEQLAQVLFNGSGATRGLSSTPRSFRQFPLGTPFPRERWLGKVGHSELKGKSATAIASLLRARMSRAKIGQDIASGFVSIDEVGRDLDDTASGPALLGAMKILSRSRHKATSEPLSRRVIFYVAPKMVANVGSGHDRDLWDSTLAAARLSGAVFLQMYHADAGRITGASTAQEFRDYIPVWARAVPRSRLHLLLTDGGSVSQDEQWRRARQSAAGRAVIKNGVGAYRLNTASEGMDWLRNWNRYVKG